MTSSHTICIDCDERPGVEPIQVGDLIYYRCEECDACVERERRTQSADRLGANDCVPNEDK